MGKERSMNLENICKTPLKAPCFNRCVQLSVNVESTNRAGICGLRRKNTVNDARYLRDGWKTIRPATGRQSSAGLSMNEGCVRYAY
jgi:hypothetical protein